MSGAQAVAGSGVSRPGLAPVHFCPLGQFCSWVSQAGGQVSGSWQGSPVVAVASVVVGVLVVWPLAVVVSVLVVVCSVVPVVVALGPGSWVVAALVSLVAVSLAAWGAQARASRSSGAVVRVTARVYMDTAGRVVGCRKGQVLTQTQ